MISIALVVDGRVSCFCETSRPTIIPGVAVPLSLVGTFGVMYVAGFSINNLTLMAPDDRHGFRLSTTAIVMIENIARYIEEGEAPLAAALKGAEQNRLHDQFR